MRNENQQSPELHRVDALWREYVSNDPDLRRMEAEKRALERKRSVQTGAKLMAELEARQHRMDLLQLIPATITCAMAFGLMYVLVLALSVF